MACTHNTNQNKPQPQRNRHFRRTYCKKKQSNVGGVFVRFVARRHSCECSQHGIGGGEQRDLAPRAVSRDHIWHIRKWFSFRSRRDFHGRVRAYSPFSLLTHDFLCLFFVSFSARSADYTTPGTLACDGSILSTSSNSFLFNKLGYQFGGDGDTEFALVRLLLLCIICVCVTCVCVWGRGRDAQGDSDWPHLNNCA